MLTITVAPTVHLFFTLSADIRDALATFKTNQ